MYNLLRYAVLVVALGNRVASSLDAKPKTCRCFTATTYVTNNGCPAYEPTPPCTVLPCLKLTTTTIPGTNTRCRKTPTITSFLPCVTACPTSCASTSTITATLSTSCLPTKTPTITVPPTSTRPCWTKTVSVSNRCPEDDITPCFTDCYYLSETTVPGGPVKGCPTTPTVTQSRICKGTCDWGCGTQWVTKTATDWVA